MAPMTVTIHDESPPAIDCALLKVFPVGAGEVLAAEFDPPEEVALEGDVVDDAGTVVPKPELDVAAEDLKDYIRIHTCAYDRDTHTRTP